MWRTLLSVVFYVGFLGVAQQGLLGWSGHGSGGWVVDPVEQGGPGCLPWPSRG